MWAMRRFALTPGQVAIPRLEQGRLVPPLVTFAEAMSHTGFVTVNPDPDGVVRRIPLLVRTDEGVFPHWALALAGERLSDEHGRPYRPGEARETWVRYSPRIARWIVERYGCPLESDGSARVRHVVADPRWVWRHVLSYGGEVVVDSPFRQST